MARTAHCGFTRFAHNICHKTSSNFDRLKALRIEPYLEGHDEKSKETYWDLVDRFYRENEEMMAPQQYRAAKDDPDYFLVLIQLAYHDQDQKNVDSDGGQSLSYFNWKLFTQI